MRRGRTESELGETRQGQTVQGQGQGQGQGQTGQGETGQRETGQGDPCGIVGRVGSAERWPRLVG